MFNHSKLLMPILCATMFFVGASCKKDPPIVPPLPPDPLLDSTSHNFIWQKFTFGGDAGSCVLNDVAIINDTLAYAVGAIYSKDSAGNFDPQPYNLAVWNGKEWKLQKVPYYFQGQPFFHPIQSVFARGANDIWFCGNGIIHSNGVQYTEMPVPSSAWGQSRMNKMWGVGNDLYVVGNGGSIALFNGSSWQKLNSGTTLDIQDIYGAYNAKSSQWEILAVCTQNLPLNRAVYSIKGNSVTQLSADPIQYELFGVWFMPGKHYYVVGDGIYEKNSLLESSWKNGPLDITKYATTKIRGNDLNDLFVVGAFGEVLHYNYSTWYSYRKTATGLSNGSYASVAVKNNLVIAVGEDSPSAIIAIGRR